MEKVNRVLYFDLKSSRKSVILLFTVYFVFGLYYGFMIGDLNVIPVSIMIWVSMICGQPFQLNEKYGVNNLFATLPMKRSDIVRGRYLYTLLFGCLGISLSEILICILAVFFRIGFDFRQICLSLCIGVLFYSLITSVQLPLYFRYSHVRMLVVTPILIYFLYVLAEQFYYIGTFNTSIKSVASGLENYFALAVPCILFAALLALTISYRISKKQFLDKEL